MKKLFLVVAVFAFSFSNAQESAVKVNPIGLAFGIANAGYEFSINDTQTVTISALYYDVSGVSGFGVGGEYRFYFSDEALRGWHAGPTAGFFSLEGSGLFSDTTATIFTIGGEVGHQWIIGEHFLVDTFLGIGFVSGGGDLSVDGTVIGLGVSFGYAW